MSERAQARDAGGLTSSGWDTEELSPSIRQRRAAASAARRRRLLLIDIALGAAIALIALALADGLALVALALLIVLLASAGVTLLGRMRRRRAARRSAHVEGISR